QRQTRSASRARVARVALNGATAAARGFSFYACSAAREKTEPPSHARMILRRFRQEIVPASLATEAQAPMLLENKTQLSASVLTAIVRFKHDGLPDLPRGQEGQFRCIGAARLRPMQRCAGGHVWTLHYWEISAELTFLNKARVVACRVRRRLERKTQPIPASMGFAALARTRRCAIPKDSG